MICIYVMLDLIPDHLKNFNEFLRHSQNCNVAMSKLPFEKKNKKKQDVFVKHQCPQNGHFLRNVTLIFDLDLDDMTLISWVLSKATCIPNMSIVT